MAIGEKRKRRTQKVVLLALVLLIVGVSGVTAVLAVNSRSSQPRQLTETDRMVRAIVSKSPASVGSRIEEGLVFTEVVIPAELRAMYQNDPDVILDALVRVVQNAKPFDSMKAAAFAMELLRDGGGVSVTDHWHPDEYDKVQQGWETTCRQHWVKVIE